MNERRCYGDRMRRGTTPTNTFTVDVDLTSAVALYITYKQGARVAIEKAIDDIDITSKALTVTLTQQDTLKLQKGDVDIQVRVRFPDDKALASDIITVPVERVLKDGVI